MNDHQSSNPEISLPTTSLKSFTLNQLNMDPGTACSRCPAAVWMEVKGGKVQVFCRVTHKLIDQAIHLCDGSQPDPKQGG